jgi:hypothetical protein
VTTGHNRDDGRSYFAGFLLRHQRIGTRGHLTYSRRPIHLTACANTFACRKTTLAIKQVVDERIKRAEPSRQIILFKCLLERIKFVLITRAEISGDVMKTRCDHCRGAFGLVRRRYFDHQFCCEACEGAYKEERARIVQQFKSGTYLALSNTNGT